MPSSLSANVTVFKVQLCDFACESLALAEDQQCCPYLKIDFASFKLFKTDLEKDTTSPEWSFKASFQYEVLHVENLSSRFIRMQCFNSARPSPELLGEAKVDLWTVACGPSHLKLTLMHPKTRINHGYLKFTCVMKNFSPNLTVSCKDLRLTMQGFPAPARLVVVPSTADRAEERLLRIPHSDQGTWLGPHSLVIPSSLHDLLKGLRFDVVDEMTVKQGEAVVEFRKAFDARDGMAVAFKVPVTYSTDGEDKVGPYGPVGELEGTLSYKNLPVFAQMAGGVCVDGVVEGNSFLLIEGLPHPKCSSQPAIWQDPSDRCAEAADERPHEDREIIFDDIDEKWVAEALEKIDLPPPWEKRRVTGANFTGADRLSRRTYFVDPRSRRTTWKDPRFLPENWDQKIDPQSGKVFFQYHKTRQTTTVDPRLCPAGWDMRLSKDGRIYFCYLPAMTTTYTDPRGLPEHIDAALDDYGRIYFRNHETKSTSWDDPRINQQEVTLTKWRHAQSLRWLKEQVWREVEEMVRLRSEPDEPEFEP